MQETIKKMNKLMNKKKVVSIKDNSEFIELKPKNVDDLI